MADKHPLIEAFVSNPVLIEPSQADLASAALAYTAASLETKIEAATQQPAANGDDFWMNDQHPYRPYVVHNGILQIPIQGVLLNRFSYQFGSWATGYAYIDRALARGMADANVRGIALLVNSPGGDVAGCFELADKLYAARQEKPIRAFASDHAYSAAYALASSASTVVVSRSGGTGSVGVVTMHADWSEALKQAGIKVTFIFAGKHKVDGNAYSPLPESVKDRIQERIDRIYGVFVGTVARNRKLDEKAVRATEALTYDAQDSISSGLADRIGALDEEMVVFAGETAATEDEQMTTFTQEQMDAAVKAARDEGFKSGETKGKADGIAEGAKVGATAERERVKAIMDSDEGKSRPTAARALADAGIDAAAAKVALAAMPVEKKGTEQPKGKTPFELAMESTGNPGVGASGSGDEPKADVVDSIFASIGRPAAAAKQ